MRPFRTILFPIDFSSAVVAMVPRVTEMALRFNAAITLLHVFDLVRGYALAPPFDVKHDFDRVPIPYAPAFRELRERVEKRLEEFARAQFAGVPLTTRIEDGDVATAIEVVAERENSDLIVMSTRGLGIFRRLLLGSVAAKVLHDVSCPVLTSAHEPQPWHIPAGGFANIICAVELNPEADVILRAAGFLARTYGAKLCLLHTTSSPHSGQDSAEKVRSTLEKVLRVDLGMGDVEARMQVLEGDVAQGIRRTVMEEKADLLVVGRGHQKGHLSRVGSHLYTIIRESPCPVLSV